MVAVSVRVGVSEGVIVAVSVKVGVTDACSEAMTVGGSVGVTVAVDEGATTTVGAVQYQGYQ